jgi:hypothetical protein
MVTPPTDAAPSIAALASGCARQIPAAPSTLEADISTFKSTFDALVAAIASSDARYAFDRTGRPDAIRAVRNALPAMEAELFDVILDDLSCELAAAQEALYQVAVAATSRAARSGAP